MQFLKTNKVENGASKPHAFKSETRRSRLTTTFRTADVGEPPSRRSSFILRKSASVEAIHPSMMIMATQMTIVSAEVKRRRLIGTCLTRALRCLDTRSRHSMDLAKMKTATAMKNTTFTPSAAVWMTPCTHRQCHLRSSQHVNQFVTNPSEQPPHGRAREQPLRRAALHSIMCTTEPP